jgi:pimeloyl-ACP methyl ester carboxylesterase
MEASVATFVLIHGAGDSAWFWHLVEAQLREQGQDVVTMDLPCEDDSAGLAEYADTVVDAIGHRGTRSWWRSLMAASRHRLSANGGRWI